MFLPMYYSEGELQEKLAADERTRKGSFYPIGPFGISLYELEQTPGLTDDLLGRTLHRKIKFEELEK